jgi:hypothetical protein
LVLGSWFLVLGSWFLVLGSWFLVFGSWFLVLGSWFLVKKMKRAERKLGTKNQELGTYKKRYRPWSILSVWKENLWDWIWGVVGLQRMGCGKVMSVGWLERLEQLEIRDGFVGEEDGKEVDVDGLDLAEEFEEDFDAFFGWGDVLDGSFHPLERALGDFNFIADGECGAEGDEFVILGGLLVDFLDERGDEVLGDWRDIGSEADEAADALAEGDGAFHFEEIEFGEEVSWEEGFEPPDFATACGFAVFDAGAEDFDFSDIAEVFGGDVFAFGLGADAEPLG